MDCSPREIRDSGFKEEGSLGDVITAHHVGKIHNLAAWTTFENHSLHLSYVLVSEAKIGEDSH